MVDSVGNLTARKHTLNHLDCPMCLSMQKPKNCKITRNTPTDEALRLWLQQHSTYIGVRTKRTYQQYVDNLKDFFQALPLGKIMIGNIRAYQELRAHTCVATTINGELSNLQMCMREADLWDKRIAPLYRPLPVPKTKVRQNMSEEEERRLLAVAFVDPRRRLAGHCLVLMANTSMGFGELRHLRRCDVLLNETPPFIEVNGGTKNDYRLRSIPLNFLALRSIRWVIERWEKLGGVDPDTYVLPHRARRSKEERVRAGHNAISPPIFTEPMGQIYRAARQILREAGLGHLDPYDMRSHAITKLLSDPKVSDQMYKEIVGHVSEAMKRRYSKQRLELKKIAMDEMCRKQIEPTNNIRNLHAIPGGLKARTFPQK